MVTIIDNVIEKIENLIEKIMDMLEDNPITMEIKGNLDDYVRYKNHINNKESSTQEHDDYTDHLSRYGNSIAASVLNNNPSRELTDAAEELNKLSHQLSNIGISTKGLFYSRPSKNIKSHEDYIAAAGSERDLNKEFKSLYVGENLVKNLEERLLEINDRGNKKDEELNNKILKLIEKVESLESNTKEIFDQVNTLYDDTLKFTEEKKTEINDQVGALTAATMAKDYAEFAVIEQKIADKYRKYSLLAMFGVAAVTAITLYEANNGYFTITESIIRLSFLLIISAPAAYLTRESAKHRTQENAHRQNNLDLRAITPYIASLSPAEQSQIKTQVALRLFGARNGQAPQNDGIPINANDLLLKLLDKVDLSNKTDQPKKSN